MTGAAAIVAAATRGVGQVIAVAFAVSRADVVADRRCQPFNQPVDLAAMMADTAPGTKVD